MDKNRIFPNQFSDGDMFECTALTVADLGGNITGIPMSADFTYAATTFLSGATPGVDPDGADPWTALQSAIAYGLLPAQNAPFTARTKGELYASDWRNYSQETRSLALQHQMKAPINIGKDYYKMVSWIRTTGQGVMLPLTWFSEWNVAPDGIIPPPAGATSNHCVAAYLDSDNVTVLIKPWLGPMWGRGGYGILTKELFDTVVKDVYAFDPNGSHAYAILAILLKEFPFLYRSAYLKDLITVFATIDGNGDITHTDILYTDWSIPFPNAHHNVRALCDLEGLTLEQKNILTACVMQESGFEVNPKPNTNKDKEGNVWSTDWGLVQINDYFNIGEGKPFPSVEYVLDNPEACVRWMANIYKTTGELKPWASYTTGAYKKWLGKV